MVAVSEGALWSIRHGTGACCPAVLSERAGYWVVAAWLVGAECCRAAVGVRSLGEGGAAGAPGGYPASCSARPAPLAVRRVDSVPAVSDLFQQPKQVEVLFVQRFFVVCWKS